MNKISISRRRFLKYGSLSSLTSKYFLSSTAGLLHALSVYATEPDSLNDNDIKLLFSILRQMYPHNVLSDIHYQKVVESILETSASDEAVNEIIKNGISKLDTTVDKTMVKNKWIESSPDEQLEALKKISKTEFFSKLKQTTINTLYNNHEVWEILGYEGNAFSKGGYLHRGFNDLNWLPEPPTEASPRI
jgi:Glu-tRNA(Gln) amidotransferase subunit E-like FAD-binding protein